VTDDQRQLVAALLGRVRSATLAARLTSRELELLIACAEQLREGKRPVHCESCQRLQVDRQWHALPDEPLVTTFITGIATHSICRDCLAALHAREHSY
jgi:hypothetical protein